MPPSRELSLALLCLFALLDLERAASSTVIESALEASARSLARQCSPEELPGLAAGAEELLAHWRAPTLQRRPQPATGKRHWTSVAFSKRRRRVDTCHCCHVCDQSASKQLASTYTQAPRD